jgi:RHS repeat-associated protein
VYDGKLRRRIEKDFTWTNSAWSQTNEIHFIYDGNLVVQERNTNNQPVVEYTRGNDLSGTLQGAGGIGGLLARSQDSLPPTPFYAAHAYYHADGNGNITMLINSSQTMVAKYLYNAFGDTLAQSGALAAANTYRFSSKEWNANSGLYYYLYRFYDPNLQRWVNGDPLGDRSSFNRLTKGRLLIKHQQFIRASIGNLYWFVRNAPENAIDPEGLCSGYWSCVGQTLKCEGISAVCVGGIGLSYIFCSGLAKQGDWEGFFNCLATAGSTVAACADAVSCWQSAYNNGCIGLPSVPFPLPGPFGPVDPSDPLGY